MAKQRGISAEPDEKRPISSNGKNFFLGIGINNYAHFSKLFNARKDIEDVYKVLSASYHFESAYAEILTDEEATRNNILKKFKELRTKVKSDDRLLIYYSGHGYTEDELGYWIPVGAQKGEIGDYISNSEVRELIKAIDAKHILLISDSCFSASLLVRDASRDSGGAFDDWERNHSRWVFISGKGVVSDGKQGENSPFAQAIIKRLEEVREEAVNVVRLADDVIENVRFNYEQQAELSPLFGAGHQGGQFIFHKAETESSAWQYAVNQDNTLIYYNFLEKYPNSKYQAEALEKMRAAEDRNDWNNAKRLGGLSDFMSYLQKRPSGRYAVIAKSEIEKIRNAATPQTNTFSSPSPITATVPASKNKKKEEVTKAPTPQTTYTTPTNPQDESGISPTKVLKWTGVGVIVMIVIFFGSAAVKGILDAERETTNPTVTITDTGSKTIAESEKIGVNPNATIPANSLPEKKSIEDKVVKINLDEYNAYQRALTKNTPDSYQEYLDKYQNVDATRTSIAGQKRDLLRSRLSSTTTVKERIKGEAYEREIKAIEDLIYVDYEYKKAAIRLEKMALIYPDDEKVKKLITVCKRYL
jgi:hypothetical protein